MTDPTADAIIAALQSNDAWKAERLSRKYLQHDPDSPDGLVLLAVSLWRMGDRSGALEIYARLTRQHPDDVMHWRNYANALRQAGNTEEAEVVSANAVRLAPDDAEWLELHGLLQMELGKLHEARDSLLSAFGKSPDSPAIRIHAAQACLACRDWRAEHLVRPWREWMPLEESLQSELAEVLVLLGEVEFAVKLLEDLAHRLPAEWRVRLRLAGLYERVNRIAEAEALLTAISSAGVDASADREISHQRAQLAVRRKHYAAARTLLESSGPRNEKDYAHWFALADVCDKTGDTMGAMRALGKAHAKQIDELRMTVPHFFESAAEILPDVEARISEASYHDWPLLRAPDVSQSPVFVMGFPRSGTTLLEQMLDAHPQLQSMDERPFFNMLAANLKASTGFEVPRDLGRLDQRDCDELRKGYLIQACGKVPRRWDARLVDKNPLNMLWLPMIHRMFPEAKFILAIRHPCDVILSCYMQNFRSAVLAVAGQSLEYLAHAYMAAMENWLHHVNVFRPDVFVSHYEDLVADTPGQTRRIASFLGLQDAEAMLRFDARAREKGHIKTPSYLQVIEPINRKGLGRWHRYREYFEPVLPILQPMLEHWGYATDLESRDRER
jgi:predicted Zn-dependent protease